MKHESGLPWICSSCFREIAELPAVCECGEPMTEPVLPLPEALRQFGLRGRAALARLKALADDEIDVDAAEVTRRVRMRRGK